MSILIYAYTFAFVCISASFIANQIWKLKITKSCKLGPLSLKNLEGVSYPTFFFWTL